MLVKTDLSGLESVLVSRTVRVPVDVSLTHDGIDIRPRVPSRCLQVTVELVGTCLHLVIRNYTGEPAQTGEKPQVIVLHDFSADDIDEDGNINQEAVEASQDFLAKMVKRG